MRVSRVTVPTTARVIKQKTTRKRKPQRAFVSALQPLLRKYHKAEKQVKLKARQKTERTKLLQTAKQATKQAFVLWRNNSLGQKLALFQARIGAGSQPPPPLDAYQSQLDTELLKLYGDLFSVPEDLKCLKCKAPQSMLQVLQHFKPCVWDYKTSCHQCAHEYVAPLLVNLPGFTIKLRFLCPGQALAALELLIDQEMAKNLLSNFMPHTFLNKFFEHEAVLNLVFYHLLGVLPDFKQQYLVLLNKRFSEFISTPVTMSNQQPSTVDPLSPAIDPATIIDLTGSTSALSGSAGQPGPDVVVPGSVLPLSTTNRNGSSNPLRMAWVSNGQHSGMVQLPDLVKESTRAIKIVVPAVELTHSSSPEPESETDSDYEPGCELESENDSDYEPGCELESENDSDYEPGRESESESETESESSREHDSNADLKRKVDDRYSLDDEYDYTHTLDNVSSHRKGKTITASDVGLYQDIRGRQ
jgi:hypothetical protein